MRILFEYGCVSQFRHLLFLSNCSNITHTGEGGRGISFFCLMKLRILLKKKDFKKSIKRKNISSIFSKSILISRKIYIFPPRSRLGDERQDRASTRVKFHARTS